MGKSKYVDTTAVVNVIGSIYIQPSILENDEYHFHEDDFSDNGFHKVLFGAMYNLHEAGVNAITKNAIEDYLEQRPKLKAIYTTNKGSDYLDALQDTIQIETFKYHYDRMKKFTLLRMYNEKCGMDLNWFYDPDNIMDVKLKQQQEDRLDNLSLVEIADLIDKKITDIKLTYVDNCENEMVHAADGAFELIERLKEKPDIGYPMYGKYINTIFRGARLTKYYLRSAATGVGKALPNYTKIPTPYRGWITVGEVLPGDYLFGQDGKPTKVLQIHPQGEPKQIWKITFKSGREIESCKDHLWEYYSDKIRAKHIATTEEIYNKAQEYGSYQNTQGKYKFNIPLCAPTQYETKMLPADPYLVGLYLARPRKNMGVFSIQTKDTAMINRICEEYGWDANNPINKTVWQFYDINDYQPILASDVFRYCSNILKTKEIPSAYFEANYEQRLMLFNGFLDGIGALEKNGKNGEYKIRFMAKSMHPNVKHAIINLAYGLGLSTLPPDNRGRISIIIPKEYHDKFFRFNSKKEMMNSKERPGDAPYMDAIVSIEPINSFTDMTCFTVDNPRHLFCVGDWIVTHNTRSMIADACYTGCGSMYDIDSGTWVNTGEPQPTLYIATEQTIDEVQTMMIAFLSGVEEDHMLTNAYEEGEWERVQRAIMVLKQGKLYFESLPDFSLLDIENTIKRGIREYGARYFYHDYLHTSMKILEEITRRSGGVKLREDNILFMISIRLKDLAVKYGIFIMTSTQLNASYTDELLYDQNLLRGAKSVADKIDAGSLLLEVTDKDKEGLAEIVKNLGCEMPNVKMSVYKNRGNKWKGIFIWMNAKRGICRFDPLFVTRFDYTLVDIEDFKIKIKPAVDLSAF